MLPRVSGFECVGVLLDHGFDPTVQRGDTMWLERDRCGVPVPLERELDEVVLAAILRLAGMTKDDFVIALARFAARSSFATSDRGCNTTAPPPEASG